MGWHHIMYYFVLCAETGFVGILVLHAKNSIKIKQFK